MSRHPHRLDDCHYRGKFSHFLTAGTYRRRPAFVDEPLCRVVTSQLLRSAATHGFAVTAYCLMPDHAHVLVEAERPEADFVKWVNLWRQLSGFWERQRTGEFLWQEGYWDHTLRDDESALAVAAYIVLNPVRARLVTSPDQYPFTGSSRFSVLELAAFSDG
jgi:putative transposase